MAIHQMFLGLGAVAEKTYVDDIFSTNVYTGAGSGQVINNGIDNSSEGAMVWFKRRDGTYDHQVVDTIRGGNKGIRPNLTAAEITTTYISSFNNNGYTLGSEAAASQSGLSFAAWNFREAPGFFDIVTYTGTGNSPNADSHLDINHSLGSVPGMVIVKRTSGSSDWWVWHRDLATNNAKAVFLDKTDTATSHSSYWNGTAPTASQFTVGEYLNGSGSTYVAYLFAGGESTAATARSVDFDGTNDYLSIPDNDAWDISSSDATIECWVNFDSHNGHDGIIHNLHSSGLPGNGTSAWALEPVSGTFNFYWGTTAGGYGNVQGAKIPLGQWQHLAVTKSGSTITLYQDGVKTGSGTISGTINPGVEPLQIGGNCVGEYCDCKISNLRITKGQVLYTSSFKSSTVPLTTTSQGATASNVKLLCCNNSSATGSSVTPDTITNNNGSTASIDSPFDDPAGFVFGDAEDQNVIKHGSYPGDGSKDHHIYLGWEPSWVMIKCTTASENWILFDVMRGIVTDGNNGLDAQLSPNITGSEVTNNYALEVTGTGFKLTQDQAHINSSGNDYMFTAIRRPDGYVGKPVEAGTNVFAMAYGNSAGTNPSYVSNFPVDFSLLRRPSTPEAWYTQSRITGTNYLFTNTTGTENTSSNFVWDHNNGWRDGSAATSYFSWMWKRHAGFDVLAYKGNDGSPISHSLGKTPEMIWVKNRDNTDNWNVWHKDLNGGGIGAANYYLRLNTKDSVQNATNRFGGSDSLLPTSTTIFSSGVDSYQTNSSYYYYIAMLFASVDGISKVGSYTGSASSVTVSDVGFSPRFLLVKNITTGGNAALSQWNLVDTVRGFSAGNDSRLWLNDSSAPNNYNYAYPTSSGFVVTENDWKQNGATYIYYAHA